MRYVQQLLYDGKRLFCPEHPDQQVVEATTKNGQFSIVCMAGVIGGNCMNSAEWPDRAAMQRELVEVH